jgi:hypothetical protein
MNKCLVLKVAEIGLFESTNTKTVWIIINKQKLLTFNFVLILVYNI